MATFDTGNGLNQLFRRNLALIGHDRGFTAFEINFYVFDTFNFSECRPHRGYAGNRSGHTLNGEGHLFRPFREILLAGVMVMIVVMIMTSTANHQATGKHQARNPF